MKKLLIQAAFQNELQQLIEELPQLKQETHGGRRCLHGQVNNHDIYIAFTGIGVASAAGTTTALCETLHPDAIVMCGSAGGFSAQQKIGDLVIGHEVIDADLYQLAETLVGSPYEDSLIDPHTEKPIMNSYPACPQLYKKCIQLPVERMYSGIIATSNIFPSPPTLFPLMKQWNCVALEMEGSAVLAAANYYKIPSIVVRAISNLLDEQGNDMGSEKGALVLCSERLTQFLFTLLSCTPK